MGKKWTEERKRKFRQIMEARRHSHVKRSDPVNNVLTLAAAELRKRRDRIDQMINFLEGLED